MVTCKDLVERNAHGNKQRELGCGIEHVPQYLLVPKLINEDRQYQQFSDANS